MIKFMLAFFIGVPLFVFVIIPAFMAALRAVF